MINTLQKNIYALLTVQFANYILPLITVPYLAHVLGVYAFGRIAFAQAVAQYFVVLADFGFNLSATRQVSLIRDSPLKISLLFSEVLTIKILLMLSGFLLLLALNSIIQSFSSNARLIEISYLSVLGNVLFPVWLFQGLERMRYITIYTVTARLISVVAIFVLVNNKQDIYVAAALQSGAGVLGGVFALIGAFYVTELRFQIPTFKNLMRAVLETWPIFLSNAAITLYTSTNIIVVGLMTTPAVVGYFSAADKIVRASINAITPISQAVYPRIVSLVSTSHASAFRFLNRLLKWQGAGTLAISLALLLFSRPITLDLLGPQFIKSVSVLKCMAFLPLFIGLSNVLGIQTMLAFNMKRVFSGIITRCGIVNIAILVPLIALYGADGAAISVLTTEIAVTLCMAYVLYRASILQKIIQG